MNNRNLQTISALSRQEWDALLVSKRADLALEEVLTSGALKAVFPELHKLAGFGGGETGHKDLWAHTKIVVRQTLPRSILRWAALFHDCGKPKCFDRSGGEISFHGHEVVSAHFFRRAAHRSRLFDDSEIERISSIIRLLGKVELYSSDWSDSAVRRLAKDLGELAEDVLAVARADCSSKHADRRRAVQAKCHALKERFAAIAKLDATPPLLPKGLGTAVLQRLGFTVAATPRQRQEMKRCMSALKAMVEDGRLPRSSEYETYLAALPELSGK